MENTLENKSRFYQQISGIGIVMDCIAKTFQIESRILNGVLLNDNRRNTLYLTKDGFSDFFAIEEWQANLTPLSSITDEDAIKVARMLNYGFNDELAIQYAMDYVKNINYISVYQYLQSKGYALPWNGLSVDDLISYGWLKLSQ